MEAVDSIIHVKDVKSCAQEYLNIAKINSKRVMGIGGGALISAIPLIVIYPPAAGVVATLGLSFAIQELFKQNDNNVRGDALMYLANNPPANEQPK